MSIQIIYRFLPFIFAAFITGWLLRSAAGIFRAKMSVVLYTLCATIVAAGSACLIHFFEFPMLVLLVANTIIGIVLTLLFFPSGQITIRLAVYLWTVTLYSFLSSIGIFLAVVRTGGTEPDIVSILIVAIGAIAGIIMALFVARSPATEKEEESIPGLWLIALMVSAIFLIINFYSATALTQAFAGSVFGRYFLFYEIFTFTIYILLYIIFRIVSDKFRDYQKLREEMHYQATQEQQYAQLLNQMDRVKKQQHDFRHSLRAIRTLAESGQNEQLLEYLNEYEEENDDVRIETFCLNAPVNALLSYYVQLARQDHIRVTLQAILPPEPVLPNSVLCSMLGNLMENAIDGANTLPEEEREFTLNIYVIDGASLFITAVNTFDGYVSMKDNKYLTTKSGGTGTGLRSIQYTVEKYGGTLQIHHTEREFFTEIYIPLPETPEVQDQQ